MAATNFEDAIQNALVAAATTFTQFYLKSYAVQGTGGAQTTTTTAVAPKTVLAWSESSDYDLPARTRRDTRRRERTNWEWALQLQFDVPVSLVEFEKAILATAPRVNRDLSIGVDQQVDLLLIRSENENPVTQQSSRGTKVIYRFQAALTPY